MGNLNNNLLRNKPVLVANKADDHQSMLTMAGKSRILPLLLIEFVDESLEADIRVNNPTTPRLRRTKGKAENL